MVLERFRTQGEAKLEDWSTKQASLSERALAEHGAQLREATNSWVETTLERLDERSEEHVDSAVRMTESAVRGACAEIYDSVAQAMKKQLQGALEMHHVAGETNPQEHRASA